MTAKQDALVEVVDLITRHGLTIDEVSAALAGKGGHATAARVERGVADLRLPGRHLRVRRPRHLRRHALGRPRPRRPRAADVRSRPVPVRARARLHHRPAVRGRGHAALPGGRAGAAHRHPGDAARIRPRRRGGARRAVHEPRDARAAGLHLLGAPPHGAGVHDDRVRLDCRRSCRSICSTRTCTWRGSRWARRSCASAGASIAPRTGPWPALVYFVGAALLLEETYAWLRREPLEILFLGAACGVVVLAAVARSRSLLVVGTVALVGYIADFIYRHFADNLGAPLVLMAIGLVFLGARRRRGPHQRAVHRGRP